MEVQWGATITCCHMLSLDSYTPLALLENSNLNTCRSCSCPSNSPSNSGPRASPGRQLLVIPKGFWLRIFHKFCRAMENPPIFHGKINYFDWAMFNIAMLHVTIFVSQDLSKIWSLVAFFDNGDPTPGEVQKHTQCLVSGKISDFFIEYPLVI